MVQTLKKSKRIEITLPDEYYKVLGVAALNNDMAISRYIADIAMRHAESLQADSLKVEPLKPPTVDFISEIQDNA